MFKTFRAQTNTAIAQRANYPKPPVQYAHVLSPPRVNLQIRTFGEFVVFCLLLGQNAVVRGFAIPLGRALAVYRRGSSRGTGVVIAHLGIYFERQ